MVLAPGSGSVWIDGGEFAPGTYLYALEVNGRIGQARKFSVVPLRHCRAGRLLEGRLVPSIFAPHDVLTR